MVGRDGSGAQKGSAMAEKTWDGGDRDSRDAAEVYNNKDVRGRDVG